MKFACSSIAFAPGEENVPFDLLEREGIEGIEIAPTTVWPGWQGATPQAARELAWRFADRGFVIPAMQAVTFDCDAGELFGEADRVAQFERHLGFVAQLAGAMGARAVVFGAPRLRRRGELPLDVATARAVPVLQRLAAVYASEGAVLLIEPVPATYQCDFIQTTAQAIALAERVGGDGLGVNLDAAAMWAAGETPRTFLPASARWLHHYHLSEPQLGDFIAPQVPQAQWLRTLRDLGWPHWCSVEMRRPQGDLAVAGPWQVIRGLREASAPGKAA